MLRMPPNKRPRDSVPARSRPKSTTSVIRRRAITSNSAENPTTTANESPELSLSTLIGSDVQVSTTSSSNGSRQLEHENEQGRVLTPVTTNVCIPTSPSRRHGNDILSPVRLFTNSANNNRQMVMDKENDENEIKKQLKDFMDQQATFNHQLLQAINEKSSQATSVTNRRKKLPKTLTVQ